MTQEIRRIREDGEGYVIVKPSEYELGGFNRFGRKLDSTRNLVDFLRWNKKNGDRFRIIGSVDIAQKVRIQLRHEKLCGYTMSIVKTPIEKPGGHSYKDLVEGIRSVYIEEEGIDPSTNSIETAVDELIGRVAITKEKGERFFRKK